MRTASPPVRAPYAVLRPPPVRLEKVHWLLPKLRCAACGRVTTAEPPDGQAATMVYGPNVNAAAVLLGSEGNVPVERTAMLMSALLGVPVSAGFVARAHERLAHRLDAAGFDAAMGPRWGRARRRAGNLPGAVTGLGDHPAQVPLQVSGRALAQVAWVFSGTAPCRRAA